MSNRRKRFRGTCVAAALVALGAVASPARGAGLGRAIKDGSVDVDLRLRYETVDQWGFPEDAQAFTGRLRLGFGTGEFRGFKAYVDVEAIRAFSDEDYDSTSNGKTQYPIIADPEDEEWNQAWLSYAAPGKTTLKAGRQRILLGNERYVGNVGWRQNEQTFDAFTVGGEPTRRFSFRAGHLENANRVFGENHPDPAKADTRLNAQFGAASFAFDAGKLTAYYHQIELEYIPAASHRNVGLRFEGKSELSERFDLLYAGEAAEQSDYQAAPATVDAGYRLAEIGVAHERITIKAGSELLEGDGVYGFQTPLATLHKFQGWADRFLTTPAEGIEDRYASASTRAAAYDLLGVYHDFSRDSGGGDYGTELDLQLSRSYKHVSWSVTYADYDADGTPGVDPPPYALDTRIFWFTVQLKN